MFDDSFASHEEHKHELSENALHTTEDALMGGKTQCGLDPLLLTADAAAHLLSLSKTTVLELVTRGRLRCVEFIVTGSKRPIRRFRLDDLKAFVEEMAR